MASVELRLELLQTIKSCHDGYKFMEGVLEDIQCGIQEPGLELFQTMFSRVAMMATDS